MENEFDSMFLDKLDELGLREIYESLDNDQAELVVKAFYEGFNAGLSEGREGY